MTTQQQSKAIRNGRKNTLHDYSRLAVGKLAIQRARYRIQKHGVEFRIPKVGKVRTVETFRAPLNLGGGTDTRDTVWLSVVRIEDNEPLAYPLAVIARQVAEVGK